MHKVTSQHLTGRYAIVKIFPHVHALKVEVEQTYIDEDGATGKDTFWRLASDQDILNLNIPVATCHTANNNNH